MSESGGADVMESGMQEPLRGRIVVVTGASSGVGAATTALLLRRGARVVAVSRSAGELERLGREHPDGLHAETADVRSLEDMERAVAAAGEQWGGCDALVCNAGVGEYASFLDLSPEAVTEIIDTNLLGTVWAIRAALGPMLAAGRGDIVVVSSVVAAMDAAGEAVYAATKAAQLKLAACLDLEVRGRGVRVTTLLPGGVRTRFAMGRGRTPDMPDLQTMLDPEDVAHAVATVLSQPPHVRTTTWGLSHLAEE